MPECGKRYNIQVDFRGTNAGKIFLSCTKDGSIVDLYDKDDASGRQRWVLEDIGNGIYHIKIADGTDPSKDFLSCTAAGKVDLHSHDDRSGRQKWKLQDCGGGFHNILVDGGTNGGKEYLSCTADGKVDLYSRDDDSGRQKWKFC